MPETPALDCQGEREPRPQASLWEPISFVGSQPVLGMLF
jgi:hypothetical protein